jgi:hypothetical protein
MSNVRVTLEIRNAQLNLLRASLCGGTMTVYTGPQPPSPETAITGQKKLATLTLSDPCSAVAADATLRFGSVYQDDSAAENGRAVWVRFASSSGRAVFDCDAAERDATVIIKPAEIRVGGPVRCTSITLTLEG